MNGNKSISTLYFTSQINTPYGYESYPDYLKDIWPKIESSLFNIQRIYIFYNEFFPQLKERFNEFPEISKGFLDLGEIKNLSKKLLHEIKYLSFYDGSMNIFYEINNASLVIDLISMWPVSSPINLGLNSMKLSIDDENNLLNFVLGACDNSAVLLTFNHDADPLFLIGQYSTLETFMKMRGGGRRAGR